MSIHDQPGSLTGKELANRTTQRTGYLKSRLNLLQVRITETEAELTKVAWKIAEEYGPLVRLANWAARDYPGISLIPLYGTLFRDFPHYGSDGFRYVPSPDLEARFELRDEDGDVLQSIVLNPEFVKDPDAFIEKMRQEYEEVQESKRQTPEEKSLNLLRSLITKHPDQAQDILKELGQ